MLENYRKRPNTSLLRLHLILLPLLVATITSAHAFDELSEAQTWVYEHPHMANTEAGQSIAYRYLRTSADEEPIEDIASLTVASAYDDNRRDISLEFLSDERRVPLPDFPGFRGNPVIIAMLEHIAQSIGSDTGGGVLYFRNRIRDALAGDQVAIEETALEVADAQISATVLAFSPFVGDPYLAEHPDYLDARFEVALSDEVPGGVVSISMESKREEETLMRSELLIDQ